MPQRYFPDAPLTAEPEQLEHESPALALIAERRGSDGPAPVRPPEPASQAGASSVTLISMKTRKDAAALGIPGGGVADLVMTIALRKDSSKKKGACDYLATTYEDGKWYAQKAADGEPRVVAHGKYIFVKMERGGLRLGSSTQGGSNAHSTLANHALNVEYAGEVEFDNGKVVKWSNQSGTYLPPAHLKHQSGFSAEEQKLFRPAGTY